MVVLGGGDTPVHFLWEDNGYASTPNDSQAKNPGHDGRIRTLEAQRNGTRLVLPGSQITYTVEPGTFDGTWAIEFGLGTPWFLRSVYGSPSTVDNSDGSWTHTYSGFAPESIRIIVGYDLSSIAERIIEGAVPARISIDPTVEQNEYATVLWEGFYATEQVDTAPGSLTTTPSISDDPLSFKDATLKRGGTTEAIVQNASLQLVLNTEPVYGFGSGFPTDFFAGLFEPQLDYTQIKEDTDTQEDAYGGATTMQETMSTAKAELDFDNGVSAGSGINQLEIEGSGDSVADMFGEENIGDPQSTIQENLSRLIEDVDVIATNETQTPP